MRVEWAQFNLVSLDTRENLSWVDNCHCSIQVNGRQSEADWVVPVGGAMRWKLVVLALATALLIFVLVAPVFTIHVKLDLPPGVSPPPASQVQEVGKDVAVVGEVIVVAVILGAAGWIARRIVRHHRRPN